MADIAVDESVGKRPDNLSILLAKLIPRLGSDHDGEVIATARAISRVLHGAGLDLHDLVGAIELRNYSQPKPPSFATTWRCKLRTCAERIERLPHRDADFIANLVCQKWPPTQRQKEWLQDIYERLVEMAQ